MRSASVVELIENVFPPRKRHFKLPFEYFPLLVMKCVKIDLMMGFEVHGVEEI